MGDLEGKIALVTGGGRNVGRAIARKLAIEGAQVIINYFHSPEEARATQAELTAIGARVEIIRASVARSEQVERMFSHVTERYGRLDILVNSAASGALLPVAEITESHLNRAFDTDVKGALWCARHAAVLMNGGGAIVNVSALGAGQMVMANYMTCAVAKAGMEALTRYLAVEFAPLGIRVNTASAAMLESEVAGAFPDAARMQEVIRAATPSGRMGSPEDLANVVSFLVSDKASWVTGQVLLADGGLSLGARILSPPASVPASRTADDRDAIAIVGMGLVVPGASTPEQFWDIRTRGVEQFGGVPAGRWKPESFRLASDCEEDKTYQDHGGFVRDEILEGLPNSERGHEHTVLWLRQAMADALKQVHRRSSDRCCLVLGYTPDGSQRLEEAGVRAGMSDRLDRALRAMEDGAVGLDADRDFLLGRIESALSRRYPVVGQSVGNLLGHRVGQIALEGLLPADTEVLTVDTACSSSLYAADIGVKRLLADQSSIAVCGGAFALTPKGTVLFAKLQGLSRQGTVYALDERADGVLFADGAAVVVLKRLSRARADGDRVLGLLGPFGHSSDGKGKAIYAPNPAGQQVAVRRALSRLSSPGKKPDDQHSQVAWIAAHATGTPVGDAAEIAALSESYGQWDRIRVTSNKSLIGHTGWAAGTVSTIETLLGMVHEQMPAQPRFTAVPATFGLEGTSLTIPKTAESWPRVSRSPRMAAVSAFGFGGTNAHQIIVEDRPGQEPAYLPPAPDVTGSRIAIVGWSAHVPGMGSREEIVRWARGEAADPPASFGRQYPPPQFERVRLPPPTVRAIDRCQLMILECAGELRRSLGETWTKQAMSTGVMVGHLGLTRAAMLYADRCYLDDIEAALRADESLARWPGLDELLQHVRAEVRAEIPASSEDSFPGIMPNVIAARVANYFDLKGPNMVIDSGLSSSLLSLDIAAQYLRTGEITMALAGGINGNTLPEARLLAGDLLGMPGPELAEGAFLFALTTEERAAAAGLPVFGYLGDLRVGGTSGGREIECGSSASDLARYLGAAGAVAVLRALHGSSVNVSLACHQPDATPVRLNLIPNIAAADDTSAQVGERQPLTARKPLPTRFRTSAEYASGQRVKVQRYVSELCSVPCGKVPASTTFLPEDCYLLTDSPRLVEALGVLPTRATVLSTTPVPPGRKNWHHVRDADAVAIRELTAADRRIRHVRLVCDLSASAPAPACLAADPQALSALHDLMFATVKAAGDELANGSVIALLLGALPQGLPHPFAGLFTGLVKSVALEWPTSSVFALATSVQEPKAAVAQAEREIGSSRRLPVVYYRGSDRMVPALREATLDLPETVTSMLGPDSVVLATGGARGITAELLIAIAREFQPRLYIVGSNPLQDPEPRILVEGSQADGNQEFPTTKDDYIRARLATDPSLSVATAAREYTRRQQAITAKRTLDTMAGYCGADRVSYLSCDVTDTAGLEHTLSSVFAAEGKIDLLINAAGAHQSALISKKEVAEFRAVRDVKVRGYLNLKRACQDQSVGTWVNFGSLLGFFGQTGESDYASANDFLATAAEYSAAVRDTSETTIGWTLWRETGMGAESMTKDYYARAGSYTGMTTQEGVHHFVRELHAPTRIANSVHLGSAERATVARFYPGFFGEQARYYLRREISRTGDAAVFECAFDLETDSYLRHHVVRGYPTLPGTFVVEIAAEAAQALLPGRHVVALTDVQLDRFLRVPEGRAPALKRIQARLLQDGDPATVEVRMLTDVISPTGEVIATDKEHFCATVHLAHEFPAAPDWPGWEKKQEDPVPDPYGFAGSPVVITGELLCTDQTRIHPHGNRGRFCPDLPPDHPIAAHFTMPSLVLDGMARLGVLEVVGGRLMPVAALTGIARIDLYQDAGDAALAARYPGGIELYATTAPDEVSAAEGSVFTAVADGRVLVRMTGVGAKRLGYVDIISGDFVEADTEELVPRVVS